MTEASVVIKKGDKKKKTAKVMIEIVNNPPDMTTQIFVLFKKGHVCKFVKKTKTILLK